MFSSTTKTILTRSSLARLPVSRPTAVIARSFALSSPSRDGKSMSDKLGDMASSASSSAKKVIPDMVKEASPSTPGDAAARGVNHSEKIGISESTVSDLPPQLANLTDPDAGHKEDQKDIAGGKEHGDLPRHSKTGNGEPPKNDSGGSSGYA